MLAYYFSAFIDNAQWFDDLLLETVKTELTVISFVCFIQFAEYGAASLLLPAHHRALTKDDCLCANEWALAPLSYEMRANILERKLLPMTSNCAVDSVAAILALAFAGENDWATPDGTGGFLYDFADAKTIFVAKWQMKSLKRVLCGDAVLGVVSAMATFRCVKAFCDAGMSQ